MLDSNKTHILNLSKKSFISNGCLENILPGSVKGWCFAPEYPSRRLKIHVEKNGIPVAEGSADLFRHDLAELGIGDGAYGFHIDIPGFSAADDIKIYRQGSTAALDDISSNSNRLGTVFLNNEFIQYFRAEEDFFSTLSIKLVRSRKKVDCNFFIKIEQIDEQDDKQIYYNSAGRLVFTLTDTAESILDHNDFDILFDPFQDSKGKIFRISVGSSAKTAETSVNVLLSDDKNERIPGHLFCSVADAHLDSLGMTAKIGYSPPFSSFSVPPRLLYSPITQCNLNCVHCISRDTRKRPLRITSKIKEDIKKWCSNGLIEHIYTDYSGDILWADDRWGGELDFLISLEVPFHIDTNGVCLTPERGHKLISSKMTSLNISLDAAKPETYKHIRKGSPPLHDILMNIQIFDQLRKSSESKNRINLSLGFTVMRSNIDELEDFISIAARIGADKVECRHLEAYTSDMIEESLWLNKEKFHLVRIAALKRALAEGIQIGIDSPFADIASREGHRHCSQPWSAAVILGNGDVQVCCLPKTKIGNLNESSMEEIWNGASYRDFRLKVNSNSSPSPCRSCTYMRRPGNEKSYLPYKGIELWKSPYEENQLKRHMISTTDK